MQHAIVAHRSPPARSEPHGTFSNKVQTGRQSACGGVNVKKVRCSVQHTSLFSALWRTLCLLAQRRPAR
eukprot:4516791-Prymnesium_polylepis.2